MTPKEHEQIAEVNKQWREIQEESALQFYSRQIKQSKIQGACNLEEEHTECPESYLAWHSWAAQMAKTHRQIRCKGCGLFTIWVPKNKGPRK